MKVLETEITPFIKSVFFLDIRETSHLSSPFHGHSSYHKHPELQLTLILEGSGKRIIGTQVDDFGPGDMVFLGSDLPHTWLNEPAYYLKYSNTHSKAITLFIRPEIFSQMAAFFPEMSKIQDMLETALKGIHIFGKTRDLIREHLLKMQRMEGFEKVICLLEIVHLISVTEEKDFIIANNGKSLKGGQYSDRLIAVLKYIENNLHDQITLEEVSDLACMSKHSFCRFFKSRTNKTFFNYLIELRMDHACKLLRSDDKPISDIAFLSGYNSDSYFCKVFKEYTGESPYQYKRRVQESNKYMYVYHD